MQTVLAFRLKQQIPAAQAAAPCVVGQSACVLLSASPASICAACCGVATTNHFFVVAVRAWTASNRQATPQVNLPICHIVD